MEKVNDKFLKIGIPVFAINLIIAFWALRFLDFTELFANPYINLNYILAGAILYGLACFFVYTQQDKEYFKRFKKPFFEYAFLLGLLVIAGLSFRPMFLVNYPVLGDLFLFADAIRLHILAVTVGLGVFVFYLNRKKAEEVVEEDEANGWLYKLGLLGVFVFFGLTQIYKIYTTGIGTDEGNFLYVVRMMQEGFVPYLDFWVREAGSLFFLVPWFSLFEVSIINLRWFVFLLNIAVVGMFYLFLNEVSRNRKVNLLVLFVSVLVLQFNGDLDVYHGIFYQLASLFSVLILYFLHKYYLARENLFPMLAAIGVLVGLGLVAYKGIQAFFVIVPFIVLFKHRHRLASYFHQISTFFGFALAPILFYWIFFSVQVGGDLYHIHNIVLSDVLFNWGALYIVFSIASLILYRYHSLGLKRFRGHIASLMNKNVLIVITNVFVLLVLAYVARGENAETLFSYLYGGLFLSFPVLLVLLQVLNLYALDAYRKTLAVFYALFNMAVLVFGFGATGVLENVADYYHLALVLFLVNYTVYLLYFAFSLDKAVTFAQERVWMLVLVFNLWFAIAAVGGRFIPTRFVVLLIFLPLMFALVYLVKTRFKYVLNFFVFAGVLFSVYINANLPDGFTFYEYSDFEQARDYVEEATLEGEEVFSLDTALLAEIENPNMVLFYTPWILHTERHVSYGEEYADRDVSIRMPGILERLEEETPRYVFGSDRATLTLFIGTGWGEWFTENYIMVAEFGDIKVYHLNE